MQGGADRQDFMALQDREAIVPQRFGIVMGTGLNTDIKTNNLAAIHAAAAMANEKKRALYFPGGQYEIAGGPIDLTSYDGLKVYGAGPNSTEINQYTDAVPVMKVGPDSSASIVRGNIVSGLALKHNALQTDSAAVGLWLGHCFECVFSHLRVDNGYDLISNDLSNRSVFNCTFQDLDLFNWTNYALHIRRSAGVSGNYYRNIYTGTSSAGLSSHALARDVTGCIRITNAGQGVLDQINMEWCRPSDAALILTLSEDMIVNAVNFEGVTPRGGKGLTYVEDSNVVMGGVTVNNCRFMSSEGCTKAAIVVIGDRGAIEIENLRVLTVTVSGLTEYIFQSDDLSTGNIDATCRLGLFKPKSGHSLSGIANTLVAGSSQFKRHPLVGVGATGVEGNLHTVGNGDVTVKAELHPVNIQVTAALTAARTMTLSQYMNAGDSILTPNGARKVISRGTAATGAFNYNIANWDGTVIAALAAAGNWAEVIFNSTGNWVLHRSG